MTGPRMRLPNHVVIQLADSLRLRAGEDAMDAMLRVIHEGVDQQRIQQAAAAERVANRDTHNAPQDAPHNAPPPTVVDPLDVVVGQFACGVGDCVESFDRPKKRGAHRRHSHPGWNAKNPVIDALDSVMPSGTASTGVAVLGAPSPAPSPAVTAAQLCRCNHGMRIHERLGSVTDRGACCSGSCMCSSYSPKGAE